uniref:putative FBD-associated F-box protein At3g50710 n=1 Tax=Fragaria vesca subsp. vesca TaxID=101020 RepID=UPI0005C82420|nr:PREDICTED: putative FBD-associated F-box protein At3g50710 [Fragaria vesca subsp. vesca]XP_011465567.1 PREDICTED: putative FBD-associated F-box protein At3g50710 [Fragaria vesca subsp. vesca]
MNSKPQSQLRVRDRISDLPDAFLWHILSFLDTTYVVRTCILSTRWKNIWAYFPTLDFDRRCFHDPAKFLAFVDHALFFRYSSNIVKFRLCLRGLDVDQSRINAWINTAVRYSFVELDINAGYPCQLRTYELPKSLVICKTLVTLKLTSEFITSVPASGCFPSLKSLHLIFFLNVNVSMFEVLSNCPVLEDFTMVGILRYNDSVNFNIASPVLKTLRICIDTEGDVYGFSGSYSYTINCPKLETFDVTEEFPSTYSWGEAKSLVKAGICLLQHCSHDPSFFNVTALLAGVGALPVFENLRRLKLVCLECFCWDFLTHLLIISPILESLVLERKVSGMGCEKNSDNDTGSEYERDSTSEEACEHEDGSDHEKGIESEEASEHEEGIDHEHQVDPPDCVPQCCLSHLKIVSILGFTGERDELEMAKYLLQYCHVLNKMTISMDDDLSVDEKEKMYKEILMVPRGSRTSTVEFI